MRRFGFDTLKRKTFLKTMLLWGKRNRVLLIFLYFLLMTMMSIIVDAGGMKVQMKKGSGNSPILMMLAAGVVAKLLKDMGGTNFMGHMSQKQQQPQLIGIPVWSGGGGMGHQGMMQHGGWMGNQNMMMQGGWMGNQNMMMKQGGGGGGGGWKDRR